MKQFAILLIALLLLPKAAWPQALPSAPQPAIADAEWDRLSTISPDAHVSIAVAGHWPVHCQSLAVTDQGLSCQIGWMYTRTIDLPRSQVERIDLHHDRRNFWIGVGAMSALGFGLGASQSDLGPYQSRVGNGLLGAAALGLISAPFVFTAVRLLPGKTLYRQPFHHAQVGQPGHSHATEDNQ